MKKAAAILVLGLVVAISAPSIANAGRAKKMNSTPIRAISHNIAGGIAPHLGDTSALAPTIRQINDFDPDVVMLQEVCYTSQFLWLKEQYPTWGFRFSPSRAQHDGCNGGAYGTVLASPHGLSNSWTQDLPFRSHGREQRILAADMVKDGIRSLVAVVHLKAKWAAEQSEEFSGRAIGSEQFAQCRSVADWTRTYKARGPVIVGGDFNTPMHGGAIQPMKDRYEEVNQGSGETGRIDHIWAGGEGVEGLSGSVVSGGTSDHPMPRGTVRVAR